MDNDLSHMRITIWLTLATLAIVILFATFPSIDLRFSALFSLPSSSHGPAVNRFPNGCGIRCVKVRSLPLFWFS